MDELFNLLSSSARIDKSKRKKKKAETPPPPRLSPGGIAYSGGSDDDSARDGGEAGGGDPAIRSRDRTGKRDSSSSKAESVRREEISAFRNRVGIRLSAGNRHDPTVPDPLASFGDLSPPRWWERSSASASSPSDPLPSSSPFGSIKSAILRNIESGRWMDPTPIQMQLVPALLGRRDVMGCAPTGSGKSGAFLIPALLLSAASDAAFYGTNGDDGGASTTTKKKKKKKKGEKKGDTEGGGSGSRDGSDRTGQIRTLLLAPSRELAVQLHREAERLGEGRPGGLRASLLSKSNMALVASNGAGGKRGLDVLVATPLRLVECLQKGMSLGTVRLVVLDEADRLMDCTDGGPPQTARSGDGGDGADEGLQMGRQQSGSAHAKTFLEQVDTILAACPPSAVRCLCSATMGPAVRHLAESVLRDPVDVAIGTGALGGQTAASASSGPTANSDVKQSLTFVGQEEGKLLAIRQMAAKGLKPPVIIFLQSKDRAQALFGELMYDGINVDVVHAGRSQAARDESVAKFRRGETWVLISTDLVARGVDFKAVNTVINYDLPTSGVTYVHRIGRTGRAGRKGEAITLFTEADFERIRPIANVMRLSGCDVPNWILSIGRGGRGGGGSGGHRGGTKERIHREAHMPKRNGIDTTPTYDKNKKRRRRQAVEASKRRKGSEKGGGDGGKES